MATSKNKTPDGRRRNKHSLFANTFEADMPWNPRDIVRRRSRVPRYREEIGKQLSKRRQLRSFTSWREMKKALDNSLCSNTEVALDVTDNEDEVSSSTDDRCLTVRLEPARLSLPPQFQTRRPMERSPLTLLFLKEEDVPGVHPECPQKQSQTTCTYIKFLKRVITVVVLLLVFVYIFKPFVGKINDKYS